MAVKQITYMLGQSTDATHQAVLALQSEVCCLQALHHPNIVRYLGVERDDVNGVISICLEYCAGGSIATLLSKFGPFNEELARSYMRMILAGLTFLHTRPGGYAALLKDCRHAKLHTLPMPYCSQWHSAPRHQGRECACGFGRRLQTGGLWGGKADPA